MDKKYILNIFNEYENISKTPTRLKEYIKNNYVELYEYLMLTYPWAASFKEIKYCVLFDIIEQPICPVCSNPLKFYGTPNKIYSTFCSKSCYKSKVGLEIVQEKYKQACLEKYNVDYYVLTEKFKKDREQTFIEKYGNAFPQRTELVLQRYIENNYRKYGVCWPSLTEESKQHYKDYMLEHYGVLCYLNIAEIKEKSKSQESIDKSFNTYKRNHPNGKSKCEQLTYLFLLDIFGTDDVETQYKSSLYPYHCDFYIKSLDLYIELNGHLSHGPHPYNSSNIEDIELLNKWKSKDFNKHPSYKKYIEVWTLLDPKKLRIAEENNLHYLVIYEHEIDKIKTKILNEIKYLNE